MPLYHLRITKDAIAPQTYFKYFTERTNRHLLVTENPDKECEQIHLHVMFESNHLNDQAVRREIKKWFPALSGNKDYSLKTADDNGWVYVSKGPDMRIQTFPLICSKYGVTEDEIVEWHNKYWETRKQTVPQSNKTTEIHQYSVTMVERPPKKKVLTWTQRLIQKLKDEDFQCTRTNECLIHLTKRVLREMAPDGKALDDFILTRMVQSVFNGLIVGNERDVWEQTYAERVHTKMTIL